MRPEDCSTTTCPKCHTEETTAASFRRAGQDNFRIYDIKKINLRSAGQKQFAKELEALQKKLKGRRYTPEIMKLRKMFEKMSATDVTTKTNPTERKIKTNTKSNLFTRIIKKETIFVNGKLMMKIVKGITKVNQKVQNLI